MRDPEDQEKERPRQSKASARVRATITFPSGLYRALEGVASEKKVSLAWVVRDAAEQYIAAKAPLFRGID